MASKMVSLKLTPKEARDEFGPSGAMTSASKMNLPQYPYDSRVTLGTEALDKLGCSPSDFETGQVLTITAKVEVIATSDEKRQGGKDRQEVRLQITDLSLDTKAAKKKKAEDKHLNSISGSSAGEDY